MATRAPGAMTAAPSPPWSPAFSGAGGAPQQGRPSRTWQFSKTKMCKFEIIGMCAKGEQCPFAHGRDEMKPLPDLTCTKLCKTLIQTGVCENKACKYAHSKEELRATSAFHKTKLCRFSQDGHCALGNKCNFAHSPDEIRKLEVLSPQPQPQPLPTGYLPGVVPSGGTTAAVAAAAAAAVGAPPVFQPPQSAALQEGRPMMYPGQPSLSEVLNLQDQFAFGVQPGYFGDMPFSPQYFPASLIAAAAAAAAVNAGPSGGAAPPAVTAPVSPQQGITGFGGATSSGAPVMPRGVKAPAAAQQRQQRQSAAWQQQAAPTQQDPPLQQQPPQETQQQSRRRGGRRARGQHDRESGDQPAAASTGAATAGGCGEPAAAEDEPRAKSGGDRWMSGGAQAQAAGYSASAPWTAGGGAFRCDGPAYVTQTASDFVVRNTFLELGPIGGPLRPIRSAAARLDELAGGDAAEDHSAEVVAGHMRCRSADDPTFRGGARAPGGAAAPGAPIAAKAPGKGEALATAPGGAAEAPGKGAQPSQAVFGDVGADASWGASLYKEPGGFVVDQADQKWQVKNTFLTFSPQAKPMRSVRTAEGALCTLGALDSEEP